MDINLDVCYERMVIGLRRAQNIRNVASVLRDRLMKPCRREAKEDGDCGLLLHLIDELVGRMSGESLEDIPPTLL